VINNFTEDPSERCPPVPLGASVESAPRPRHYTRRFQSALNPCALSPRFASPSRQLCLPIQPKICVGCAPLESETSQKRRISPVPRPRTSSRLPEPWGRRINHCDPNGIRTRVTAVKGRCPGPLDDRVTKARAISNRCSWTQDKLPVNPAASITRRFAKIAPDGVPSPRRAGCGRAVRIYLRLTISFAARSVAPRC
jgi:hypothetical protein